MLAQLQALPAQQNKKLLDAAVGVRKLEERHQAAQTEIAAACEALGLARSTMGGLAVGFENATAELQNKLIASADIRLDELKRHLGDLTETVRSSVFAIALPGSKQRDMLGNLQRGTQYATNQPEAVAALQAIKATVGMVEEQQLQVLTRAKVTEALRTTLAELATALRPLDLHSVLKLDEVGAIVRDRSASLPETINDKMRAAGADSSHMLESATTTRLRQRDVTMRNLTGTP